MVVWIINANGDTIKNDRPPQHQGYEKVIVYNLCPLSPGHSPLFFPLCNYNHFHLNSVHMIRGLFS